jgi:hypothetical protein
MDAAAAVKPLLAQASGLGDTIQNFSPSGFQRVL